MHAAAGRGAARGAVALAEQVAALGLARHAAHVALLPLLAPERRTCPQMSLDLVSVSHRAKLLRVRQLIDRDVIPVLEPLRIALGMELVDCTNMRC